MEKYGMKLLVVTALFILISGCIGLGGSKPAPSESYYDVPYVAPSLKFKKPLLNGTLGIARPETDAVHDNVQILFTYSDKPYSVNKHIYHLWQDAPSSLIQKRLKNYFSASGIAKKVVLFEPAANVKYLLKSRIHRLERFVNRGADKNYDEVVFGIEVKIINLRNYKSVYPEVYYEQRVKTQRSDSANKTVYASIIAFGNAFKQAMDSFVQSNVPKKNSRTAKKNGRKSESVKKRDSVISSSNKH